MGMGVFQQKEPKTCQAPIKLAQPFSQIVSLISCLMQLSNLESDNFGCPPQHLDASNEVK